MQITGNHPWRENEDIFHWGYATPGLSIYGETPLMFMRGSRTLWNTAAQPVAIRPLRGGVADAPTAPYLPGYTHSTTGNRTFRPAGGAPLVADWQRMAGHNRFLASHSTGAIKNNVAFVPPRGSNSLWEDGRVEWRVWGSRVVSPARHRFSNVSYPDGWTTNSDYYRIIYWGVKGHL